MKRSAVLSIDQGTTGTRAILYGRSANVLASGYEEFPQYYPRPGWVEHDPEEIWKSVLNVISWVLRRGRIKPSGIAAIGITNQRETTVLWDRVSGNPLHRAIVWQDRRTTSLCERLRKKGCEEFLRARTGLVIDPYFSGSKVSWLFDHDAGLRRKASKGHVLFGTIDSWLLWKLTGGASHKTDFTNASRTLFFDIKRKRWDKDLLGIFKVPRSVLPEVRGSGSYFGETVRQGPLPSGIPIFSMVGDQQAALYGQGCYHPGEVKNTYGTGCFVVLNLGKKFRKPPFGLLSTLACGADGGPVYAWEGSVFIAGAAIQWLRDGLSFFKQASETEHLIRNIKDTSGVVFIPAFTGLGSPYWNPRVRGMISGITRGTRREHIVRAALESIAHQTADVLGAMERRSRTVVRELKVDGGATANRFLMQFQADLLGRRILVSDIAESTAWGAAKLAGQASGFWTDLARIDRRRKYKQFVPRMQATRARVLRDHWTIAMRHLLGTSTDRS